MICIYLIESPSGKKYVGQTEDFEKRMKGHRKSSTHCTLLKRAIDKYGWDHMKVTILLECSKQDMNMYEQMMIKAWDTVAPNGYNCDSGGNAKKELSSELKNKIKSSMKEYYSTHPPPCHGMTPSMLGKHHSEETKEKLRKLGARNRKQHAYNAKGCIFKTKNGKYMAITARSWNDGKQQSIGTFESQEIARIALDEFKAKKMEIFE